LCELVKFLKPHTFLYQLIGVLPNVDDFPAEHRVANLGNRFNFLDSQSQRTKIKHKRELVI